VRQIKLAMLAFGRTLIYVVEIEIEIEIECLRVVAMATNFGTKIVKIDFV